MVASPPPKTAAPQPAAPQTVAPQTVATQTVPRVALLPSEPIRRHMAGAGIRYFELARRLPAYGLEVVLLTPGEVSDVPVGELPGVQVRRFERRRLASLVADCQVGVSQGQLCNDLLVKAPELPCAVDLHDPFLAEHLHYAQVLGLGPFLNDHATWVLQLSRGDHFLCASEEQRDYYLGFLTALGRIHPARMAHDPDPGSLVSVVPYGVPEELPPFTPVLPERRPGERRLLFGGLYDWYDPWPVLEALEAVDEPSWTLLFIRNPNPGETPQRLFGEVETWCRRRGWWGGRVKVIDWVPAERRYDLWRDVDLLVATHTHTLETRLSLRIRFLDALAAGCSVVTNEGGAVSRLLRQYGAGWVVPSEPAALAPAYRQALSGGPEAAARQRGARELVAEFHWSRVLEPLVAFCRRPAADPTKKALYVRPPRVASPDQPSVRLRRTLGRLARLQLGFGVKGWLRRHGLLR